MSDKEFKRKGFLKLLATGAGATAVLSLFPKGDKSSNRIRGTLPGRSPSPS